MEKDTINIIVNLILIVLLIGIALYIYINIDEVKLMVKDPCKICEEKTGGLCYARPDINSLKEQPTKNPIG